MKKMPIALAVVGICFLFACQSAKSKKEPQNGLSTWPIQTDSAAAANTSNEKKVDSVSPVGDTSNLPLVDTYWVLTELGGNPYTVKTGKRGIYIRLKADSSVEGFSGCNRIGGRYEIKTGDRIRFDKLMGTLMACDDLKLEDLFKASLQKADNYNYGNNKLVLNKARMAPLARFVAKTSLK
ncbi:MAG TPA: META domain-containing protein [Flavihumibacter sp.]|nr:META domain-containing protein [Flavihumibacter sp.]HQD08013.1 META domain-containing protein [Flavihumibacter sp.]